MKKVVIAMDSLKGSMTSLEAGTVIQEAIHMVQKETEVVVKPLADGGEGTTEALIEGLHGERIEKIVTGPLKEPVMAVYGWIEESKTAIMEMASAAGIVLLKEEERNPWEATTYGVGELIKDAVLRGAKKIILGIGGSATNDGGIGMLKALGYEFLNQEGDPVGEGAKALSQIQIVQKKKDAISLEHCQIEVVCDVNNPLCGKNGATYIFGPQKGVKIEERETIDRAMSHFADVTESFLGVEQREIKGAGAAGGLGFALVAYLQATLRSGIDFVLEAVNLEEVLQGADLVVTGEGRLDYQTAMGKAPIGVAKLAKKHGIKVIAFAGSVTKDARICNEKGIDAYFPIIRGITTLEEATKKENAKENLKATAEQVFRLLL
ncbi:MAG TPA: glycerate kinase [Candidatus Scybalomonas excrementigallinarum]|nr:glycerate kinase [Candidatus Scybalomonas excrementigallinarum]